MNDEYKVPQEEQATQPLNPLHNRTGPDWESRENTGFLDSLFSTWREIIVSPVSFFKNMRTTGGLANPLLFLVIFSMLGAFAQTGYNIFWTQSNFLNYLPGAGDFVDLSASDVIAQSMSPFSPSPDCFWHLSLSFFSRSFMQGYSTCSSGWLAAPGKNMKPHFVFIATTMLCRFSTLFRSVVD